MAKSKRKAPTKGKHPAAKGAKSTLKFGSPAWRAKYLNK